MLSTLRGVSNEPALEPSMEAYHHVNSPYTGRNSGVRRIIKKNLVVGGYAWGLKNGHSVLASPSDMSCHLTSPSPGLVREIFILQIDTNNFFISVLGSSISKKSWVSFLDQQPLQTEILEKTSFS